MGQDYFLETFMAIQIIILGLIGIAFRHWRRWGSVKIIWVLFLLVIPVSFLTGYIYREVFDVSADGITDGFATLLFFILYFWFAVGWTIRYVVVYVRKTINTTKK